VKLTDDGDLVMQPFIHAYMGLQDIT